MTGSADAMLVDGDSVEARLGALGWDVTMVETSRDPAGMTSCATSAYATIFVKPTTKPGS